MGVDRQTIASLLHYYTYIMKIVALLMIFAFIQVESATSVREAISLLRKAFRTHKTFFDTESDGVVCPTVCPEDEESRLFLPEKCILKCEGEEEEEDRKTHKTLFGTTTTTTKTVLDDECPRPCPEDEESRLFLPEVCIAVCKEEDKVRSVNEEATDLEETEKAEETVKFLSKRVVVLGQKYKNNGDGTTVVQPANSQKQRAIFSCYFGVCEYCDFNYCWLDCC